MGRLKQPDGTDRQEEMGHSDVPARLPYVGGDCAVERVPSDNLPPAQRMDTFPTGTEHLPRLTGLDGRAAWEGPCFGASKQGHGKCAGLYEHGWGKV